jgi:serine/threonine-protein kinase
VEARVVGRYLLCEEIASGGMASVHLGQQRGDEGFRKTVAIKRLHVQFAKDPDFASGLLNEGRMQARIHHPNVAAALDVVRAGDDLLLVMEYVFGASLHELVKACRATGEWPSLPVVSAILAGTLRGLHAAHEARSTTGAPLGIVHRDISPHNVIVGADGAPRVVDFGIAHAAERSQITREGTIKGKPGYMAPEQIRGEPPSRATDVYAAGVVLWELCTHERLFPGGDFVLVARAALDAHIDPPSAVVPTLPRALDAVTVRAVARDPADRYPTAAAFADAIEGAGPVASAGEVAAWVARTVPDLLARRAQMLERVERGEPSPESPSVDTGPSVVSAESADLEVVTSLETASSAAVLPARQVARRQGAFAIIGVLALAVGLAGGLVLGRGSSGDAKGAASASSSTSSPSSPSTAASSVPQVPEPPASTTAAAPTTSATSATSVTAGTVRPSTKAVARPSRPAPAPQGDACVTVGADGIKHWNPRCK